MKPQTLLSSFLLLTHLSAAWQPFDAIKREIEPLLPRQKTTATVTSNSASSSSSTTVQKGKTTTSPSSNSNSASTSSASKDGKSTGKGGTSTNKSDDNKSSSGTITSKESTKTFNPELPAGGVQMISPNTIAQPTQFYRISEPVTFAWNYTSLKATPSAVNVLVTVSNPTLTATYTVKTNMPIAANGTQSVVWDTNKYAQGSQPLAMASYTLVIYDAQKPVTALPQAGYLGTYNQFWFGMYAGQPYTAERKYQCATCSGALGSMERVTLGFVFGMAGLTILSFGWFGGVAGVW